VTQLALPLRLADHAVFDSFLSTGNETLVAMLGDIAAGNAAPGCWIWGATATGKTHLLQATCDLAGDRSVYLPLDALASGSPAILDGLASREIICLDNIDKAAGIGAWEQALFALCNEALDAGSALVVSAGTSVRECPMSLPDLQSRLTRLPAFRIRPLDDEQRVRALQLRARHRGLELPDDTANFLLNRSRRDMGSLYTLLDQLDREALRAQRRLTIPFVREIL